MLILHDNVESGNAYKARLLLSLMGKEYKCIQYDVVNGETRTDEFLKKYNKNGRIPVLEFEDGKCLAEFIKTFPNKYKFYSCEWVSGIIIRKVLLPVDDQSYFHFAGNVFCVPFEKENIFINAVRAL